MAKNETLHKAKEAKNDEFYTQMADIQTELNHTGYQKHLLAKPYIATVMIQKSLISGNILR